MKTTLLAVASTLILTASACSAQEHSPPAWAALTELGMDNVAMQPGANVRVFNDINLGEQDSIDYDESNGYLTLQPGTYRIDGWSLTTFGYELTQEQRAATFSAPGYSYLWDVDAGRIEILGSMQDPLDSQPSVIDGVVEVTEPTQYYLAHQNGKNVSGISLQVFEPEARLPDGSPSTNHAFAQLVVERM